MITEIAVFNHNFSLEISPEDAARGSHRGDCSGDVAELSQLPYIRKQLDQISLWDLHAELLEYGAWEGEELMDHEENLQRILWIACGNITEELAAR